MNMCKSIYFYMFRLFISYNFFRIEIFCKLTKEIILSRPSVEVICEITFLFKVASQNSSFVEFLLNKSKNSATSKKGILYFNEGWFYLKKLFPALS